MIPTWVAGVALAIGLIFGAAVAIVVMARSVLRLVAKQAQAMTPPVRLEPPPNLGQECAKARMNAFVEAFKVVDRWKPGEHGALCGCHICEAHRELRGMLGEVQGRPR